MADDLRAAMTVMASNGYPLVGEVPWVGGGKTLRGLTPDQAYRCKLDPIAFAAEWLGVSEVEFREWLDLDGMPFCGATTKSGKLCSIPVGHGSRPINEWLAQHRGEYCKVHGGPGRGSD